MPCNNALLFILCFTGESGLWKYSSSISIDMIGVPNPSFDRSLIFVCFQPQAMTKYRNETSLFLRAVVTMEGRVTIYRQPVQRWADGSAMFPKVNQFGLKTAKSVAIFYCLGPLPLSRGLLF